MNYDLNYPPTCCKNGTCKRVYVGCFEGGGNQYPAFKQASQPKEGNTRIAMACAFEINKN